MNAADPLLTTLLDLLYELRDADFPLVLGGGYGLADMATFLTVLHELFAVRK